MKKLSVILVVILVLSMNIGCIFNSPVIINFSANPGSITAGGSAYLNWNVTGANIVKIDQGIGNVGLVGSQNVFPSGTTSYTLTAVNNAGTVTAITTVIVTAPPPVITNFSANPPIITRGETSNLQWNVTGAASITITPAIGNVAASGSQQVSPTATTTYMLTATNNTGSVTATTILTVNPITQPPVASFTVTPSSIAVGRSATLQWDVTGATTVYIDNGIGLVQASGVRTVSPTYSTTYTLSANNDAGLITKSVYLDVQYPFQPYPNPYPSYNNLPLIVLFDISPGLIPTGGSAVMSWQVIGASSVSIDQSIGHVYDTGATTISPATCTTYTLTASNSYGSVTASATAFTGACVGLPIVSRFTVSPTSIQIGQSATLRWNIAGATSISIDHGIGPVSPSGSIVVAPVVTTTYTMTASNAAGTVMRATTINVHP